MRHAGENLQHGAEHEADDGKIRRAGVLGHRLFEQLCRQENPGDKPQPKRQEEPEVKCRRLKRRHEFFVDGKHRQNRGKADAGQNERNGQRQTEQKENAERLEAVSFDGEEIFRDECRRQRKAEPDQQKEHGDKVEAPAGFPDKQREAACDGACKQAEHRHLPKFNEHQKQF